MLAVVKLVGRGLEDRDGDRAGGGIGPPAGMLSERFGMRSLAGHGQGSLVRCGRCGRGKMQPDGRCNRAPSSRLVPGTKSIASGK